MCQKETATFPNAIDKLSRKNPYTRSKYFGVGVILKIGNET